MVPTSAVCREQKRFSMSLRMQHHDISAPDRGFDLSSGPAACTVTENMNKPFLKNRIYLLYLLLGFSEQSLTFEFSLRIS